MGTDLQIHTIDELFKRLAVTESSVCSDQTISDDIAVRTNEVNLTSSGDILFNESGFTLPSSSGFMLPSSSGFMLP